MESCLGKSVSWVKPLEASDWEESYKCHCSLQWGLADRGPWGSSPLGPGQAAPGQGSSAPWEPRTWGKAVGETLPGRAVTGVGGGGALCFPLMSTAALCLVSSSAWPLPQRWTLVGLPQELPTVMGPLLILPSPPLPRAGRALAEVPVSVGRGRECPGWI